jgi:two-component system sensor histidine kinase RegB
VWVITRSVSKYVFSQREQLSQMKIYAEKMDRLRAIGALTAGFSHEFASPLNTIKLRLNRISRSETVKSEDITATLEAVDSCEKIIRHMNQAQLDKRDFIFQSINLPNALEGIVESWKTDHPDAKLLIRFSPTLPALLKMPIINFSQGLLNVLDNAYESNPDNSITVDISAEDSKLLVCITDNGEGFSKDVLARFGEPFVTTKKEGTGLGLYSFLLFAQSIGGSVSVSNLHPKGAMVKFTAPLNT